MFQKDTTPEGLRPRQTSLTDLAEAVHCGLIWAEDYWTALDNCRVCRGARGACPNAALNAELKSF